MSEKYYLLESDSSNYKQLELCTAEDRDYISSIIGKSCSNPKKLKAEWIVLEDEEDLPIPDVAYINSFIPVCSQRVYDFLLNTEYMNGNEFIPIKVEEENWYILNICTYYEKILNLRKSKISKYDDGSISWIFDFVFKKEIANESLFYLKEQPVSYFCTNTFVKLIEDNNIKGLNFVECKIKKSIF